MNDPNDPMFVILGAIQAIDANFHSGYAAEHPELLAAMVQASAIRSLAEAVATVGSQVEVSAHAIANAMAE